MQPCILVSFVFKLSLGLVGDGQWNIRKFPKEDLYWGCGGEGNISKFPEADLYLDSLLAHLSHRLRVSYCHWPMSVVRRASSTIALKNISSETARPRALIFGM